MIATTADTIARIGCLLGQHFPCQINSAPLAEGERHTLDRLLPSSCHCLLIFCSVFSWLFLSLSLLTQLGIVEKLHLCKLAGSHSPKSYIQPFEIVLDLQDTVKSRRIPAARLDLKEEY